MLLLEFELKLENLTLLYQFKILASLHWLPVYVRPDFKVLLNGHAPSWLSDLFKPYWAFSYRDPFLWHNLAADIRKSDSVEAFKSKLKNSAFDHNF